MKISHSGISITVLFDNYPLKEGIQGGWGFSCLIDGVGKKILFDTGARGDVLLSNMEKLAISPADISLVVISHFHGDHTGGLDAFLTANSRVVVYCPAVASGRFREGILRTGAKVAEVPFISQIQPGVWLVPGDAGSFEELALVLETDRGLVVVTGCAHPGLETFVREIRDFSNDHILFLMGGFHLEARSAVEIREITDMLKNKGLACCAPCHCSGKAAKTMFRNAFEGYMDIGAGARIELKDLNTFR